MAPVRRRTCGLLASSAYSLSQAPDENLASQQPSVEDEADCLLGAECGCVYTHSAPTGMQVKVEPAPPPTPKSLLLGIAATSCLGLQPTPGRPVRHHPITRKVQVSTQKPTRVLRLDSISLGTEVGFILPAPTSALSPLTSQVSPKALGTCHLTENIAQKIGRKRFTS